MGLRMPLWATLSAGAAVFIGCGIFFAFQDLGTANDYATIASFFLALLTAGGSLLSFKRSKQEKETAPQENGKRRRASKSFLIARNVGFIQDGDHNTAKDINIFPQYQKKKRKRRR
jgi:hypothetical protein